MRTLVYLMLHAGLRVSEAVGLDIGDIQLVEHSGTVTVRFGKDGKRREVPLNRDARAAVATWLGLRGSDTGTLFPGDKGGRLRARAAEAAQHVPDLAAWPEFIRLREDNLDDGNMCCSYIVLTPGGIERAIAWPYALRPSQQ